VSIREGAVGGGAGLGHAHKVKMRWYSTGGHTYSAALFTVLAVLS
jgi:hypothetical protein